MPTSTTKLVRCYSIRRMEGSAWIGLAAAFVVLEGWNFLNSALCITSSGDLED